MALTVALYLALFLFLRMVAADSEPAFFISPYLQLGKSAGAGKLAVLWAARTDASAPYVFQWKSSASNNWSEKASPVSTKIGHASLPFSMSCVELSGLPGGTPFDYRIFDGKKKVFEATAHLPKPGTDVYNFAVFGDCAWEGPAEKTVARRVYEDGVDFAVVTGDIVYHHGRISEYLSHFFPVYNSEDPQLGAPLLRSTLFVAAPGNHDLYNGALSTAGDLHNFPDGLGYFLFWDQPLNGPQFFADEKGITPISASSKMRSEFLTEAGDRFPNMASFSFNYGNAHWTILDSNPYADWKADRRAQWLEADLKSAAGAKWRFVAFHHPPFHSGHSHANEQHMRNIVPLLEKYNVDVVFNGHVHNYQRSHPLKFLPNAFQGITLFGGSQVNGEMTIDRSFDGITDTTPQGPVYIVSGCGGAPLSAERALEYPEHREPFTASYAATHSYTRCQLNGSNLLIRQIATDGQELDHLKITK